MNEGFQLRLRRNGRTWPIDAFDANGIILKQVTRDGATVSTTTWTIGSTDKACK